MPDLDSIKVGAADRHTADMGLLDCRRGWQAIAITNDKILQFPMNHHRQTTAYSDLTWTRKTIRGCCTNSSAQLRPNNFRRPKFDDGQHFRGGFGIATVDVARFHIKHGQNR